MILAAFYAWRGGMGGHGPLPYAGGYLEQPAIVMDAFQVLAGAVSALTKAKKRD